MQMPLRGRAVLVTRPADQATELARAITARGGTPVLLPAIEIRAVELSPASKSALAGLAECEHALFISANAVTHGLAHVERWPPDLPAYAVGEATARALARHGVPRIVMPEDGSDSEALLRLPALNAVAGGRIVIFRGIGGRELLAQSLRARGARVDYVESYERRIPQVNPDPVLGMCERDVLHAVCANSGETLENLLAMVGERGTTCLRRLPVFVPHVRLVARAHALGFARAIHSGPGDEALLAALEAHFGASDDASER